MDNRQETRSLHTDRSRTESLVNIARSDDGSLDIVELVLDLVYEGRHVGELNEIGDKKIGYFFLLKRFDDCFSSCVRCS